MITVKIDETDALNLLMERLEYWNPDDTDRRLFEEMYQNCIGNGCFDGGEFNPMVIVDNDWVNWCAVVSEGDDNYEEIKKWYEENGLGDCSCDIDGVGFIEAYQDDCFLIRY